VAWIVGYCGFIRRVPPYLVASCNKQGDTENLFWQVKGNKDSFYPEPIWEVHKYIAIVKNNIVLLQARINLRKTELG
jgi:hypothetical protein